MKEEERSGIQVIARATTVLRALEREPDGLSLGEIATRVNLPRSTVQRIVGALVEERMLVPASSKARFKLGPTLAQLGAAADAGTEKLARPFMLALAELTDETVDLSILRRESAVFVDQIQGNQRLAAISAIGGEFPLHCTANGKALLALLTTAERSRQLSGRLRRFTDATITDHKQLESGLEEIRLTGLAFDLEEHSVGICAIGAAFRDSGGSAYSLSIPVPTARFAGKRRELARLLKKTVVELRERLHSTNVS